MGVPRWRQPSPAFLISSHCSLFFVCATGLWERWRYCDPSERPPCVRVSWEWGAGSETTTPLLRSTRASSCSRSEEHTSELQSLTNLVCRLLLEKKKHASTLDQS